MWHLCVGMNADSRTVDMHRLLAENQLHMFGRFSIIASLTGRVVSGSECYDYLTVHLYCSFMSAELCFQLISCIQFGNKVGLSGAGKVPPLGQEVT